MKVYESSIQCLDNLFTSCRFLQTNFWLCRSSRIRRRANGANSIEDRYSHVVSDDTNVFREMAQPIRKVGCFLESSIYASIVGIAHMYPVIGIQWENLGSRLCRQPNPFTDHQAQRHTTTPRSPWQNNVSRVNWICNSAGMWKV